MEFNSGFKGLKLRAMEGVRRVMKATLYVFVLRTVPGESLKLTAVRLFEFAQILWLMSHTAVVVTNPLFAQTGVEKMYCS